MKPTDFDIVIESFEKIESSRSRNEKMVILTVLASTPCVSTITREILTYLLNPFWSYGIRLDNKDYKRKFNLSGEWSDPFDADSAKYWPAFRELLDLLKARIVTGIAARYDLGVILNSMSNRYSWFLCNLLNRDLKCGVTVPMLNKAFPDLVKPSNTFTVVGYKKGIKGKPHENHCGSLQIQGRFKGVKVLSWVGQGFTDRQRDDITKRLKNGTLLGTKIDVEFQGSVDKILGEARADGTHAVRRGVFKGWRKDLD